MGSRLLAAAAAAAVALGLLGAAPSASAAAGGLDTAAAAAQCGVSLKASSSDAASADAIMAGTVSFGAKGTLTLAADPDWQPQTTLDRSGNANVHTLTWALPLLREGVRRGDQAMVDRFYWLLQDWARDVPPAPISSTGPYSALPEGYRMLALACAAAGPRGAEPWLAELYTAQAQLMAGADHFRLGNNTSLHQSMGLYVAGVVLRRGDLRATGLDRMALVAEHLLLADGSDLEGAPGYSSHNYVWFGQAVRRIALAGDAAPAGLARATRIADLLTHATRPDGRLETIGDTEPTTGPSTTSTAQTFARTLGARGTVPASTFAAFEGGYVFDRSGWGTGARTFADETFWSMRTGRAASRAIHGHADTGSLTLSAHGSALVDDPGLYAYDTSARRKWIVSRAAHSVVTIPGRTYTRGLDSVIASKPVSGGELVTITDRGYAGVLLTRTVYYHRASDTVVVWDSAARTSGTVPTYAEQRWQIAAGRKVVLGTGRAATSGTGGNLSMRWPAAIPSLARYSGSSAPLAGWSSPGYGQLQAATTLVARRPLSATAPAMWLTVLAPRAAGVGDSAVTTSASLSSTRAHLRITTTAGSWVVDVSRTSAATS